MELLKESLLKLVRKGGTLVDAAEAQRREAICRACPHMGAVNFVGFEVDGCKLCKCPLATLTRAKTHILKGGIVECSDKENKKW